MAGSKKKSLDWPPCERRIWNSDMVMKVAGGVGRVRYDIESYLTEQVQWVSTQSPSQTRQPVERTWRFRKNNGFTAAGKDYKALYQLRDKKVPDCFHWYEDIYGREVFCIFRRKYPAMDADDTMYDNRLLRWYFLREDGKLTRIYHADGSPNIYVTEDVAYVEYGIWRQMRNERYFG